MKRKTTETTDKRPDPKPRKRPQLWQAYQMWDELVQLRKRHTLRISSIELGKSNLDVQTELDYMEQIQLDALIEVRLKIMSKSLLLTVPNVAAWLASIKGLGGPSLSSQLIAQIDDIAKFETVSKLWRFSGQAVFDGKAERGNDHYNRRLKSVCYLIAEQFIRQQTPVYAEIYYDEKRRLRDLHPEPAPARDGSLWPEDFTDSHVDRMARRKMIKIFLCHLWQVWRADEGLSVDGPYAQDVLGHAHIVKPASL